MIINEEEKPIIEILFNLYATGKYSFEKISDILYKKGYKNKKGNPYSGTTLKKFILNPRYKGYYTANMSRVESYKTHKKIDIPKEEQIIYKSKLIEPIVSEELWNKANELYRKKRSLRNINVVTSQKVIDESIYTNKLICKNHNEYFIRCAGSNRKSNPSWVCKKYKNKGVLECNSPIIREKCLNIFLANIIEEYIKDKLFITKNEIIDLYNEIFFKANNKLKIEIVEKIKDLRSNRDKLIDLNLSNIISSDELKKRLLKNDKEINKAQDLLNNMDLNNNYYDRLKCIDLEIDKLSSIKDNLKIYIDLLIEKIEISKLNTRFKMNLDIHFRSGEIKNIYYEN
ncbi:MAG: recombinase family protein [bacterium]|nr:recombinase family protein [bacterium]